LRVGILSPIAWRTPPRAYGPWELVASNLAEGLVARGHDVTLFATADSVTSARLEAVAPAGYEEDRNVTPKVYEALHIARAMEQADRFDVLHNHFDFLPLAWSRLIGTPMITTIHGFSSPSILPVYREYDADVAYVSISDADRDPSLTYKATIYNGIRPQDFTFKASPGDYAVCFSRIHPDKGVHLAIEAARMAGITLLIAGLVQDKEYFEREVEPHVDGNHVHWLGMAGPEARDRLLGGALALIHLVTFEEPFGLAMVEAMACGTPVIATPRGAVPEVVTDGVTGMLVEDAAGAANALAGVGKLDRGRCRDEVTRRFSVDAMVDRYVKVYSEVVAGYRGKWNGRVGVEGGQLLR
jgi:glycosyltransferase involved in cell wall biosynthesis